MSINDMAPVRRGTLPPLLIDARGRFVGFPYCCCGHQRGAHAIGEPGDPWAECRMDGCKCATYRREVESPVAIESLREIAERIARLLLGRVGEFIKTNRRKPSELETARLLDPLQRAETELLNREQSDALGVEFAKAWPALLKRALVEVRAEQQRRRKVRQAVGPDGDAEGAQEGSHHGP